jgi:hypothetical protein
MGKRTERHTCPKCNKEFAGRPGAVYCSNKCYTSSLKTYRICQACEQRHTNPKQRKCDRCNSRNLVTEYLTNEEVAALRSSEEGATSEKRATPGALIEYVEAEDVPACTQPGHVKGCTCNWELHGLDGC